MTQASIAATDTSKRPLAHPGVALGALGILAAGAAAAVIAGATTASLSMHAALSDPALAALVSAAIGVAALVTLPTIQRFVRRQSARPATAG